MNTTHNSKVQPKVSVAMTTYNHEPFIAQAIESVLMQQTDFAVEVIIGEDCSPDRTREIVRDFGERYPERIRLMLPEQNLGARANCAAVFGECRGEYIAYLEGDDYWTDPLKLQKQVDFLDQHPEYCLSFHRVQVVYEGGTSPTRELGPAEINPSYSLSDYLRADLMQTGSIMVRGDIFLERPRWYDNIPLGDWSWVALLAEHGDLGYIDEVMGVYRKHPGGIWSGQAATVQLQQQLLTLKVLNEHFEYRYQQAVASRVRGICASLAELLVRDELDTRTNKVSKPAAVVERGGVADYLSAGQRSELLGEFYASLLFGLYRRGHLGKAGRCLPLAVRYKPTLLRNRGVWSIAAKALLASAGLQVTRTASTAPSDPEDAGALEEAEHSTSEVSPADDGPTDRLRAEFPHETGVAAPTIRCLPSSPGVMQGRYLGELVRGLEREGFPVVLSASERDDLLERQWLVANAGKVQLLHFHWTEHQYERGNTWQSWKALAKYFAKLVVARRLGYGIVWTMHNYMPHEETHPLMHRLERLFLARWADAVIVHCARGKSLLRRRLLRTRNVFEIPHGDFTSFMEHPDRATSRQQLGLGRDDTMLLFFGSIRPYKGVPELLQAFQQIRGGDLKLFVAGKPLDEETRQEIETLAAPDPRIQLRLYYVPEAELCTLLSAADAAVLPYHNILGSGALLTALGYGLPVIAPSIGAFPEIIDSECGTLYDPEQHSLEAALSYAVQADLRAMGEAAKARAGEYPWSEMVRETCAVYRHVLRREADKMESGNTRKARAARG